MASGVATVKEVVSGDTVVIVGCPRGGPPPEKRLSLAYVRAPRVAMKSLSYEQRDEPYGFIAREFMRRKLIGQTVEFSVDPVATAAATRSLGAGSSSADGGSGSSSTRAIGTIKFNGEDVRFGLVRNGLAKLDNSAKNLAAEYPLVQELERCQEQAQQEEAGVWNPDAAPGAVTVRDIQWALNDPAAAKAFAAANKDKRVPALVEYVRDGGCVRVSLYIDPKQQQELQQQQQPVLHLKQPLKVLYASVLLSGVQCDGFKREQPQDGSTGGPAKIVAEPFAEEARFFVEARLLNREVNVRIEGADEVGNLYGSLYHPRGNISILLLQNGLARIQTATVGLTEAGAQMRVAMQEAQQKRLRRWKNWQSSTANVAAKQYTAVVAEVISGDLLLLQLPDGSERRVYLSSVRCLRGTAAGGGGGGGGAGAPVGGRGSTTLKDEDSMAFQAKEFVRKKLIGKKVRVCVDYLREITVPAPAAAVPGRGPQQQQTQFVSVYLPGGGGGGTKEHSATTNGSGPAVVATPDTPDGQNIAALLVQQGLAKTVQHRGDDERARDYETYVELEKSAQQRRVGLHAPQQQWLTFRIVDLTGPANVQRAHAHFQQLERVPRLDCIVDYVFNASRYKLRVPSQNLWISFALSGVRSPQASARAGGVSNVRGGGREAEPFGDEALAYARSRLLQREVRVKVEAIDKGGNFLGTLWHSQGNNFAAELLELGLAHTVDFSLARTPFKDLLIQAERKAQGAKLKLWSLQQPAVDADGIPQGEGGAAAKDIEVDESLPEVIISHTENVELFYIQEAHNKNLERVNQALAQYGEREMDNAGGQETAITADDVYTPGGPPRRGELVLAKFTSDGTWYRARVEGTEGGANSSGGKNDVSVMYIDFGNSEVLSLSHLRRCPPALKEIPPQAKPCCLSGLLPPPEMDVEAASFFESLTHELVFCCTVEKIDTQRRRHVILTPQETSGSAKAGVTINEKMVRQGLARLDKKSKTRIFHRLQLEEQAARKAHINVWRYGDCGADDEEDNYTSLKGKPGGSHGVDFA
ncbi:LOW QUALITY PROTEIN: staphylococcal nuclease domain-containing protein 1-like [Ochotona princeps]|uniref:LOW QUALITY PROTEIN: staphylococcal nuclease domain-containing protein 1-like n=1 Tax=Ochotona princeps TaxID=9978 RepID=UPI00271510BF|nr:LOW QUALITY PROTEIN: staphylococcal nuclease domain-containing protein 1-like [Ochotona princeps]